MKRKSKKLSFKKRFDMAIEQDKQSMLTEKGKEFLKKLQAMVEDKENKK